MTYPHATIAPEWQTIRGYGHETIAPLRGLSSCDDCSRMAYHSGLSTEVKIFLKFLSFLLLVGFVRGGILYGVCL